MSQHVSHNADVAVVTGVQRQSGGRQSHAESCPGGGCHKPSSDHRSTRWGMERKGGQEDEADCKLHVGEKFQLCAKQEAE